MLSPIDADFRFTRDSASWVDCPEGMVEIPYGNHVGAFKAPRRHHLHEGIDIYCPEGQEIFPMEGGIVVAVGQFTGEACGSPWWEDTWYVVVESEVGFLLYGEIIPEVNVGDTVEDFNIIGTVTRVLKKNKGRPMHMLHLEWYTEWNGEPFCGDEGWLPDTMKNPAELFLTITR